MTDTFGRELSVGDFICYAVTAYRSGVLRTGFITSITPTRANLVLVNQRDDGTWYSSNSWNTGYAQHEKNIVLIDKENPILKNNKKLIELGESILSQAKKTGKSYHKVKVDQEMDSYLNKSILE